MSQQTLYTRDALIESIGIVRALAQTANANTEYLHYAAREFELRKLAETGEATADHFDRAAREFGRTNAVGPITEAEETRIESVAAAKVAIYTQEEGR